MVVLKSILIAVLIFFGASAGASDKCSDLFLAKNDTLKQIQYSIVHGLDVKPKTNIFARILRGRNDLDFSKLSSDRGRNVVMLMDASGLESIFSRESSGTPLEKIGYTRDYIEHLRKSGIKFKVALIKPKGDELLATWDNLLPFLERVYGPNHVVVYLYKHHINSLKKYSYIEILKMFKGEINPKVTSTSLSAESTLLEFRSFLFNELRLTELYTGLGFTITPEGYRGLAEYFVLNQEFRTMDRDSFEIVDLSF